ncbi:hypothetical protein [Sorangium sp. So ce394]|uniref:hypothetical protein n=1 Tax=Sorangium sp. So ce394 TaxID=3133310 RepID=UPI003F5B5DB0
MYMIQRAKLRPAIVVSVEPPVVSAPVGAPEWQVSQTVYVAPAYGCDQDGSRAGWNPEFLKRIKMCMYPQYMLDRLPLPGSELSVVRFDQVQPMARSHKSIIPTDYRLSDEAVSLIHDWMMWVYTGEVQVDSVLDIFQTEMKEMLKREKAR